MNNKNRESCSMHSSPSTPNIHNYPPSTLTASSPTKNSVPRLLILAVSLIVTFGMMSIFQAFAEAVNLPMKVQWLVGIMSVIACLAAIIFGALTLWRTYHPKPPLLPVAATDTPESNTRRLIETLADHVKRTDEMAKKLIGSLTPPEPTHTTPPATASHGHVTPSQAGPSKPPATSAYGS